jgi:calmodulin
MAAFRMFDKDGSGLVSSEELSEILSAGGSADFESMIKEYDDNGDGQISFDEFATMMKRLEK